MNSRALSFSPCSTDATRDNYANHVLFGWRRAGRATLIRDKRARKSLQRRAGDAGGVRHLLVGLRSGQRRRGLADCARYAIRGAGGRLDMPELRRRAGEVHEAR